LSHDLLLIFLQVVRGAPKINAHFHSISELFPSSIIKATKGAPLRADPLEVHWISQIKIFKPLKRFMRIKTHSSS
jgi:hypothetical protein